MTACEKCKSEIENLDVSVCEKCVNDAIYELETVGNVFTKVTKEYNERINVLYNEIEK